jgi:DNA-binding CsgD family transcriptional regulator
MNYLVLLFFLVVCMSGIAVLSVSVVMYAKFRRRLIIYYSLFLGSLFLLVLGFTTTILKTTVDGSDYGVLTVMTYVYNYASMFGIIGCVAAMPPLFQGLIGLSPGPVARYLYWCLVAFIVGASVAFQLTGEMAIVIFAIHPVLFGTILYSLVMIARNFQAIGDPLLKSSIKVFFAVSVVFLPFIVVDASPEVIALFPASGLFSTLTLPLYFLVLNVLSIYFAVRFFGRPAYFREGAATDYFFSQYRLTAREQEIVTSLIGGNSNKAIGEQLFISPKTVENHLSRIYQKTGVKNRLQLMSLIQTNRA